MRFLDFLKPMDINQGLNEYKATQGAVLLDVRTVEEYKNGRIPGSKNVPLQDIAKVQNIIHNKKVITFNEEIPTGDRYDPKISYWD